MKLGPTALASLLNTATSAAALFVVFRFGFREVGGEFIGLWALVSGLLMFARIADTGASVSVARLAVIGRANNAKALGPYLWAGLTVATVPTLLLSSVIVVVAGMVLGAGGTRASEIALLPQVLSVALIYAVGNSAAGIISGCLDGVGRMVWRFLGGSVANLVLIGLAVWLLPTLGQAGFLIAHTAYIGVQLAIYIVLLFAARADLSVTRGDYLAATRDSFGFLSKSIFLGAARTGFEPVSKMLIGQFGGLTAVALFDLAVRVSSQLRQLANAPLQPIAVLTARSSAALQADHRTLVERWMPISIAAGFVMALGQVVSAPLVSWLMIGHIDASFVMMSAILAVSFFVNFSGTVAFYVVLASGRLRGLIMMHIVMTALNVALGVVMGWIWGAMGVVAAWGITLAIGGPTVLGLYLVDHPMSARRRKAVVSIFVVGLMLLSIASIGVSRAGPLLTEVLSWLVPTMDLRKPS